MPQDKLLYNLNQILAYYMFIKNRFKDFKRKELLGNEYNNPDHWVSKPDAVPKIARDPFIYTI